jgi:hypothetical protein
MREGPELDAPSLVKRRGPSPRSPCNWREISPGRPGCAAVTRGEAAAQVTQHLGTDLSNSQADSASSIRPEASRPRTPRLWAPRPSFLTTLLTTWHTARVPRALRHRDAQFAALSHLRHGIISGAAPEWILNMAFRWTISEQPLLRCPNLIEKSAVVEVHTLSGQVVTVEVINGAQRDVNRVTRGRHPSPDTVVGTNHAPLDNNCLVCVVRPFRDELKIWEGIEQGPKDSTDRLCA